MSEISQSPEYDFVPLEKVQRLQSLAMGVFRERARREVSRQKMTGFVLLDSMEGDMQSNAVDTYMGFLSQRITHDYWQFTVSFLTYMMNHELRYSNYREQFRFNWNAEGRCIGTKIITDNYYPVTDTRFEPERGFIDTVDPSPSSDWRPLDDADCDELRDRVLATAANVEHSKPKRFGADWNRL